ncbi:MAG: pyridine nucleotide-disulfide oxidoreductase [Cyanobacteria bacterium SIG28]|nr:pyridine nucleotide-disulfide oxidoreductase [Cyanobacteria bacterium SIG28]
MKIVIIGGVAAGAKAAAKSRRILPDSEIDIYTQDTHVSYSACGLPYYIEGNFEDWQKLIVRSVEEFEKTNIHIHTLNRVTKILPIDKKIIVKDLKTNEISFVNYDKLVIATGSTPRLSDFPEIRLKNIFTLKTLEDGIAIRNTMREVNNITLIGGGYISIELLEAFVKNGKNVTLVEKNPFILSVFDEDISLLIQNYILENSQNLVKIITDDVVDEFIGEDYVKGILTAKGSGFETEMVVISTGVNPVVDIAKDAGIAIGVTGAIKVNSRMQTNVADIYACGDCAEKINIISNTPVWIPLGSTANKEGRTAAVNLCGGSEDFEGILGSAVTRYFNLNISMSGLSEKNAQKLGYDTVSVIVTKKDKAGYMPEVENITLKLIADRRSHRILGAQAIGCGDADKKVNTVSIGLSKRITVENLLDVDLTYAPPFSTSVDILHSAARMLKSKLS